MLLLSLLMVIEIISILGIINLWFWFCCCCCCCCENNNYKREKNLIEVNLVEEQKKRVYIIRIIIMLKYISGIKTVKKMNKNKWFRTFKLSIIIIIELFRLEFFLENFISDCDLHIHSIFFPVFVLSFWGSFCSKTFFFGLLNIIRFPKPILWNILFFLFCFIPHMTGLVMIEVSSVSKITLISKIIFLVS